MIARVDGGGEQTVTLMLDVNAVSNIQYVLVHTSDSPDAIVAAFASKAPQPNVSRVKGFEKPNLDIKIRQQYSFTESSITKNRSKYT